MVKAPLAVACPSVFRFLYDRGRHAGLLTLKNVFEQVEEWLILELNEIIRVPHVAACSVVFNLLCDLGRPAGVARLIKNAHFLIFLAVWVLFLSFWAG